MANIFVAVIICILALSNQNHCVFERPNAPMVVTALQPARMANIPVEDTIGRSRLQRRQILSSTSMTATVSKLTSSISDDNELDDGKGGEKTDNLMDWRSNVPRDGYASPLLWETQPEYEKFLNQFDRDEVEKVENEKEGMDDILWEQVKLEALTMLSTEPEAGPHLYQNILSQESLTEAIVGVVASM